MTYRVNHSRSLHRARNRGADIVCADAPFEGQPVEYAPRSARDPQPWRLTGRRSRVRLSGRQCRTKDSLPCHACGRVNHTEETAR